MPSTDDLRYDEVVFKASHNTYDHGPDLAQLLDTELEWNESTPCGGGCRGLEFDIIAEADNREFCVKHEGAFDPGCLQLSRVLGCLSDWSERHPAHDVIHVSVDIKKAFGTPAEFAENLDRYIRAHFDRERIYRPGQLLNGAESLAAAAAAHGWPTLRDLGGRFVFCLSGSSMYKGGYAATLLPERLCFSDRSLTDGYDEKTAANRLFVNVEMGLMSRVPYQFYKERKSPGILLRAYSKYVHGLKWVRSISSRRLWTRCRDLGVNILATDRIHGTDWASVHPAGPFTRRGRL